MNQSTRRPVITPLLALVLVSFALVGADCGYTPLPISPVSLTINSSQTPGPIAASPVTFEAVTDNLSAGTVRFFDDNAKLIAQSMTATPSPRANQLVYAATVAVSRADNGSHAYFASVTYRDAQGIVREVGSYKVAVQIQLP